MKRKAMIVTLSLVMCLLMAFPASAALYPTVTADYYPDFYNRVVSDATSKGYTYFAFFHDTTAWNYMYAIASKTENVVNGDTILRYQKLNSSTATSISSGGTNKFISIAFSGSTITYTLNGGANNYTQTPTVYFPEISTINFSNIPTTYYRTLTNVSPPPDISALQALLAQAKAVQNTGYTQSTWNALQSQMSSAESLLASSGYTQQQVDSMTSALQSALNGLVLLPTVPDLPSLLAEADTIGNTGYTDTSWSRFAVARTSARALLASRDYTQGQYDAAYAELSSAMSALTVNVVVPPEPDPEPAPLGYDLRTGDISGYLNVMPKITYRYIDTMKPIFMGIFGIIISILIIPRVLAVFIPYLRR